MRFGRALAVSAALIATVVVAFDGTAGASAAGGGPDSHLAVSRQRPDARVAVVVRHAGEALVDVRAAAPGTDWATPGAESVVVSISVDGRYAMDLVVTGAVPVTRQLALGAIGAGRHVLGVHFASERTPATARDARVVVDRLRVTTYNKKDPQYQALRFAPIVYGRNLAETGGQYQNSRDDTPLIAWHERMPASTPGHTVMLYSYVWSNEDGGTGAVPPALIARWGRTTDIEWVYAVELDGQGERVPGRDAFQADDHQTVPFAGRYEGDHALLQTCTSNNTMCDKVDDPMRFFLSTLQTLPAGQPREHMMDVNPWTYAVMAKEMVREGKIEAPGPATAQTFDVSDERNYLYAVVDKTTVGANDSDESWVGVALGVRLTSGETVYLSNHGVPLGSIQRDGPAATAIELPAGTTVNEVAEVTAYRTVVGTDSGAPVHVTHLGRGFLLDHRYRPGRSVLNWTGDVELTAAAPSAVLWHRG
jgi:hypothetical protein